MGSVTYAAASFVLSILVIRIIGNDDGGIFSFGYSTLNQIAFIISYFGIRGYQIVDVKHKFTFNDYFSHRIITCILSIITLAIYLIVLCINNVYVLNKVLILFFLVLCGVLEGFSDCFDCEFQRNNKLYLTGQAMLFRTIAYCIILLIVIYNTRDLLLSVSLALIAKLICVLVFNVYKYKTIAKNKIHIKNDELRALTSETYSIFVIVLVDIIIFSLPKLFIDIYYGNVLSGFFNLYFMPVNILYLLVSLILRPLLTPISNIYHKDKYKYNSLFKKIIYLSLALCLFVLIMSVIFSKLYIYIINLITKNLYLDIYNHTRIIFVLNMFGGALYSIIAIIYYILIIDNKQKFIMYAYLFDLIIATALIYIFINKMEILGASISFVINNMILLMELLLIRKLNV